MVSIENQSNQFPSSFVYHKPISSLQNPNRQINLSSVADVHNKEFLNSSNAQISQEHIMSSAASTNNITNAGIVRPNTQALLPLQSDFSLNSYLNGDDKNGIESF